MNTAHLDRNHPVGEALAVCMDTGIEILPHKLPRLAVDRHENLITPGSPCFFTSPAIKQIGGENNEANKTNFTRMVGGIFAGNHCYCVFNTRDSVMKWSGGGEIKSKINLQQISDANSDHSNYIRSVVIFGTSPEVAMASIESTKKISRKEYRFDSVFERIFYISINEYGGRFLKFLTILNRNEELLSMMFSNEDQSF